MHTRFVVDYTVVEPQASRYPLPKAATTVGYAAATAAQRKVDRYHDLLQDGDTLCIPAFETHGAVSKDFHEFLRQLASNCAEKDIKESGRGAGQREDFVMKLIERKGAEIMRSWQISLSFALCLGRLDMIERLRAKLFRPIRKPPPHADYVASAYSRFLLLGGRAPLRG